MQKKYFLWYFLFVTVLSINVITTTAQKGNNGLDLNIEGAFPVFKSEFGLGFSVKGLYGIKESAQLTLSPGLRIFQNLNTSSENRETTRLISVLLGYQQNFGRFWLEPKIGLGKMTGKVPIGGDFAKPSVAVVSGGIGAGLSLKKISLGINFLGSKGIEDSSAGLWYNRRFTYTSLFIDLHLFRKKTP